MHPEIITFLAAMTPFLDMKLAIPLGRELGLSSTSTIIFTLAGTIIPAAIFLALISPISNFLRNHSKWIDNFFTKLFKKTRKEHTKNFQRYGALFILAFVAIPLPGSGTAAGSLIAFLFGVEYWKALSIIVAGALIGALLLTAGVESVFALASLFNRP